MILPILTPYPCPKCGRNLRFYEGMPGFFDCSCGYIRMNGERKEENE